MLQHCWNALWRVQSRFRSSDDGPGAMDGAGPSKRRFRRDVFVNEYGICVLQPERIRVGQSLEFSRVERLDGVCLVDPDIFIELLRQRCREIVAREL